MIFFLKTSSKESSPNLAGINRQFPRNSKVQARTGSKFGRGVFAVADIDEGEIICEMKGPLISTKQHIDKYGSLMFTDPMQIDKDLYVDLIEPYRFFNHSCDPNAGIRKTGTLFALRAIKNGEEVFYDYSTTCDDPNWIMNCDCRTKDCRKEITEFLSIPLSRRQHYFSKSAILDHIKDKYF